jgi:hypothetical protein
MQHNFLKASTAIFTASSSVIFSSISGAKPGPQQNFQIEIIDATEPNPQDGLKLDAHSGSILNAG